MVPCLHTCKATTAFSYRRAFRSAPQWSVAREKNTLCSNALSTRYIFTNNHSTLSSIIMAGTTFEGQVQKASPYSSLCHRKVIRTKSRYTVPNAYPSTTHTHSSRSFSLSFLSSDNAALSAVSSSLTSASTAIPNKYAVGSALRSTPASQLKDYMPSIAAAEGSQSTSRMRWRSSGALAYSAPSDTYRLDEAQTDVDQPLHLFGESSSTSLNRKRSAGGRRRWIELRLDLRQYFDKVRDARETESGGIATFISARKLSKARQSYYELCESLPADSLTSSLDTQDLRSELRMLLTDIIKPHVQYSDSQHIEELLKHFESMSEHNKPPLGAYTMLLQTYIQQIDVPQAFNTFARIREYVGVPPVIVWTMLVTLFANRRDPESANRIFEAMLKDGVEPSQHTYTSLMNAYVEAGAWDEAIQLFDRLDAYSDHHPLKPDLHTCTTLMKAYVLMGAPVTDVLDVYSKMVSRKMDPSSRTFALLLQSACDASMLDLAEEIFAKMDAMPGAGKGDHSRRPANVYTFSIMIRGLLRAGMKQEAKEYYDEMVRRGIEPSSATWSILVTAYANVDDDSASPIVQNLLDEFLDSYLVRGENKVAQKLYNSDKNVARGTALQSIFGPVISAYAQSATSMKLVNQASSDPFASSSEDKLDSRDPAATDPSQITTKALATFRHMLTQPQSKPSLIVYTALLDSYRKANDLSGLRQIWSVIFDYAIASTQTDYASSLGQLDAKEDSSQRMPIDPSRRNLLCLPLSVCIDALSANHMHEEIAQMWINVQNHGFSFDAGNWNHLAVALVRAGDLKRAFWTVDKILLEPQVDDEKVLASESLQDETDTGSDSSDELQHLQSNMEEQARSTRAETPVRPPNRAHEYQREVKEQIERRGYDLRLPEHGEESSSLKSAESIDDILESQLPTSHGATLTSHGATLGGRTSLASPPEMGRRYHKKRSTGQMTECFTEARSRAHRSNWRVHAATLRTLEDAFTRLEEITQSDETVDDTAVDLKVDGRQEHVAEQIAAIRQEHGGVLEAIAKHRRKLDDMTLLPRS